MKITRRTARAIAAACAALSATTVSVGTQPAANAATCDTATMSVAGRTLTKFVPSHVDGDRDYAGHGPDVSLKASLELFTNSSGGTTGRIRTAMNAVETVADWTTVNGVRYSGLFVTPAGYRLTKIVDNTGRNVVLQDSKAYRDTDHTDDLLSPGYVTSQFFTSFVSRYVVTGDTAGDEAGTRTGVTLSTKGMHLTMTTC